MAPAFIGVFIMSNQEIVLSQDNAVLFRVPSMNNAIMAAYCCNNHLYFPYYEEHGELQGSMGLSDILETLHHNRTLSKVLLDLAEDATYTNTKGRKANTAVISLDALIHFAPYMPDFAKLAIIELLGAVSVQAAGESVELQQKDQSNT